MNALLLPAALYFDFFARSNPRAPAPPTEAELRSVCSFGVQAERMGRGARDACSSTIVRNSGVRAARSLPFARVRRI